MTATEKARRSDALYYETVSVTRRVLCDMIANREGDLEDARAENAKLREQSERLFDKTLELATENSKLRELCKLCEREAENAKLRELVLVLKNCADENGDCDACPINNAKPVRHPWFGCDTLRDMMRELGIEGDA